jgi:hypothetical protein
MVWIEMIHTICTQHTCSCALYQSRLRGPASIGFFLWLRSLSILCNMDF